MRLLLDVRNAFFLKTVDALPPNITEVGLIIDIISSKMPVSDRFLGLAFNPYGQR